MDRLVDDVEFLNYCYIGDDEKYHLKDNAPNWAKKEFEDFYNARKGNIISE